MKNNLSYRRSVIAIIKSSSSFLLVQVHSYGPKEWKFPGGGIEIGETPLVAVYREIEEELGLLKNQLIFKGRSKFQYQYDFPADNHLRLKGIYQGQLVDQFGFQLKDPAVELAVPNNEIRNAKWVDITQLEKYLVYPNQFDNAARVIKELWKEALPRLSKLP